MMRVCKALPAMCASLTLAACALPPPEKPNDICHTFDERAIWLSAALAAEERWNIPSSIIMAFIHQESSFISDAQPGGARNWLERLNPWDRPASSAYGYAQALDGTWGDYKKETDRKFALRSNFGDAVDFIGWYNDKSARTLRIRRDDAYRLYLAYHEGHTGYRRGSYGKKPKLLKIARRVDRRKRAYARQLRACADDLDNPWYVPNFYL